MQAADIGPVAPDARTQSALDLFLIFAGANVAPTLQVGASLTTAFTLPGRRGPYAGAYGFAPAGVTAWMSGAVTYHLAAGVGATLPALAVAIAVYGLLRPRDPRRPV